ncbi:MAG: adenine phosphoribosyltransferase, partial [Actinomycetota bacterium]
MTSKSLADHIRAIPDYPKPGVTFRDITPLLGNGPALADAVDQLARRFAAERVD